MFVKRSRTKQQMAANIFTLALCNCLVTQSVVTIAVRRRILKHAVHCSEAWRGRTGQDDTEREMEDTEKESCSPVKEVQGAKMSKEAKCEALEKSHVHDVYASTAHHFARVRYKAWPRVRKFIMELEPGSLVADVGKFVSVLVSMTRLICFIL